MSQGIYLGLFIRAEPQHAIATASRSAAPSEDPVLTRVFMLKAQHAPHLGRVLRPFVTPGGQLKVDEIQNAITITDRKSNVKRFSRLIEVVDKTPDEQGNVSSQRTVLLADA